MSNDFYVSYKKFKNKEILMAELVLEPKAFGGRIFHECSLPKDLEGSTYYLNYSEDGKRDGPFVILFILYTEFMACYDDLAERNINLSEGYTNIVFPVDFVHKFITVPYQFSDATSEEPDATIKPILRDNILRSMEVTIFEQDFDRAIRAVSFCVSSILDSLSFPLKVPLNIRDIVIFSFKTGQLIGRYITVPYFPTFLEKKEDLYVAKDIPKEFCPYLRLFREAFNSTSPYYRLLCLFNERSCTEG